MFDLLMSADMMVADPDGMAELLVSKLGIYGHPRWRQAFEDHPYIAHFLRVHKSLAISPTRVEPQWHLDKPNLGDPMFHDFLDSLMAYQGAHRPMLTHSIVLTLPKPRFSALVDKLMRRKLRFRLAQRTPDMPFDRLWLGVTPEDPHYEPSVDGGLCIEVMCNEPLQLPLETFAIPAPQLPNPEPGQMVRVSARGYLVRDLDETLRKVSANLMTGMLITENLLDKPVLLLRDTAGVDASATVEPGQQVGQADVTVTIRAQGTQASASLTTDNFGARAAGSARLSAEVQAGNLLTSGDAATVRALLSEASLSHVYRLGYTLPVAVDGTKLSLNVARADYALGKQFAALGASGKADIQSISLIRPLFRSRENNLYALLALEHKNFTDETATPASASQRRIMAARLGLLGNFVDDFVGVASSSYAFNATMGRARLDPLSLAVDQEPGGPQTSGGFSKFNLEYQRAQSFGGPSSLHFNLQAQLASKNLSSGEKMALGGPSGVRGYPVGEGLGDAGLLFNLEYRYQLPAAVALAGEPVSLAAFYDHGAIRVSQDPAAGAGSNRISLGSVGIGATAGRPNHFVITAYLAWRTTTATPTTGDPDRAPRAWVSAQKWF